MIYGTPDPDYPDQINMSDEDVRCHMQDLALTYFGMDADEWLATNTDCCSRNLSMAGTLINSYAYALGLKRSQMPQGRHKTRRALMKPQSLRWLGRRTKGP
jgi:hypothetical protein